MNRTAEPPSGSPAAGDYHGRPVLRLESERLWVEALAGAGPRIVRLGLAGSDVNLLAETPDMGWDTPYGRYDLIGGHRLWFAPEDPDRVAVPDSGGLTVEREASGLRLVGLPEAPTGLVRSIALRLDPSAAALELRHELRNVGDRRIELSVWSITQLPLGGLVMLPQMPATSGEGVRPNRTVVLWPYTSWDDGRFQPHDGLMLIRARPGPRMKVGYMSEAGWAAYLRDGVLFVRRFRPAQGRRHPDLGCNVEVYCGDRYLELELLGPLTELSPGSSAVHTERWDVLPVGKAAAPDDVWQIAAGVAPARTARWPRGTRRRVGC